MAINFILAFKKKKINIPTNNIPLDTNGITPLTFIAEETNSTIKLKQFGPSISSLALYYRTNNMQEWETYTMETQIRLTNINDYVQFKNNYNRLSWNEQQFVRFQMTGKIKALGNIQSMSNYSDFASQYGYYTLFWGCGSLTTAPELPATTLYSYCYERMFFMCTNLTKAPELPATTLADSCYASMFNGCNNLNYIKVGFTDWLDEYYHSTTSWLANVSPTGTFVCPNQLQILQGDSYVPAGWTVQNGSSQEQPPAEDAPEETPENTIQNALVVSMQPYVMDYEGFDFINAMGKYTCEQTSVGSERQFINYNNSNMKIFFDSNKQRWVLYNTYNNSIIFGSDLNNPNATIQDICNANWCLQYYGSREETQKAILTVFSNQNNPPDDATGIIIDQKEEYHNNTGYLYYLIRIVFTHLGFTRSLSCFC